MNLFGLNISAPAPRPAGAMLTRFQFAIVNFQCAICNHLPSVIHPSYLSHSPTVFNLHFPICNSQSSRAVTRKSQTSAVAPESAGNLFTVISVYQRLLAVKKNLLRSSALGFPALPIMQEARRDRLAAAKTGFDMGIPFNELNRVLDLGFKPLPWGNTGYLPAKYTALNASPPSEMQNGRINAAHPLPSRMPAVADHPIT